MFQVGETQVEVEGCTTFVKTAAEELAALLRGLPYEGTLRETNSTQLDIGFENSLEVRLRESEWSLEVEPVLNVSRLPERTEGAKADFIIWKTKNPRLVLEVEKANKKTLWFDFMKVWLFMATEQADCGLLVCPLNYAHKLGVWELFAEACRYKRLLTRVAGVPLERVSHVGIIGYEQRVHLDGDLRSWTRDTFKQIKGFK
jgi:hypothetical protein